MSHTTPAVPRPPQTAGAGALIKGWRTHRRVSQMALALDAGVSPRHLSFIETGRAKPSPHVLLALAEQLQLPLRERNELLLAAGYAPRYTEAALGTEHMAQVVANLQRLLDAHQPYPGLVLNRQWDVMLANTAAQRLVALLPPELHSTPLNVFRVSLHPEGLAALSSNFAQWAPEILSTLRRATLRSADPGLLALQQEVLSYANVRALMAQADTAPNAPPALLVPLVLNLPQGRASLFTTLTTFGTPRDVTLDELCVELFYPSDAASEALLRGA